MTGLKNWREVRGEWLLNFDKLCVNCDSVFRTDNVNRMYCCESCRVEHYNKCVPPYIQERIEAEMEKAGIG